MFQTGLFVLVCLTVLWAWLLLQRKVAEVVLSLILLGVTVPGMYWSFTGGWRTDTAKGIGIFASLVVTIGLIRLGVERLSDLLGRKSRSGSHLSGPHGLK